MYIERIVLKKFGKFQDADYSFSPGFCLIYGDNEFGKSSLLDFIMLMFYGFKGQKKDARENPRLRYIDKQGGSRGVIYFSRGGESFRLERQFGRTDRQDEILITNRLTGDRIDLEREQTPGHYFFGMDFSSFVRTAYIRAGSSDLISLTGNESLTDRLANLKDSGDEDYSYRDVVENLQKKKVSYLSLSGKKGLLVDIEEEISRLKLQLIVAVEEEEERLTLSRRIAEKRDELALCEASMQAGEDSEPSGVDDPRRSSKAGRGNSLFRTFFAGGLVAVGISFTRFFSGDLTTAFILLALGMISALLGIYHLQKISSDRFSNRGQTGLKEAEIKQAEELRIELAQMETALSERYRGKKTAAYLDTLLKGKEKELAEAELSYRSIELAISTLEECRRIRTTDYLPALNRKAEEIFSEITCGSDRQIGVDSGLQVYMERDDRLLSSDYLSTGTRDQAYFALRLAYLSLACDEPLPLLLDDPFVYYDDERAASAFFYLERLSIQKKEQVLLFSCQSRFTDWAKGSEDIRLMEGGSLEIEKEKV